MALKAGPKSQHVEPLPPRRPAADWLELVTGEEMYPWQREVVADLSPSKRPRVAYVQVPRKNGKTRLAALLALSEACLGDRRHVYAISDSERNLNSVLMRELRDLVGGSDHLRDSVLVYHNRIEVPETGSFIEARPNNFRASQGINPHLVLFDEVHLQRSPDTWSGMQMAGAARPDALLFGITTPGYDLTGLAHGLYQAARAGDPMVYGRIFEAPADAHIDDRAAWAVANPCFDRPGFLDALEFDRTTLPEHEFVRFRMGRWTATATAWFPYGTWDTRAHPGRQLVEGERVWVGFDGSHSGDSTALVGITADKHLFVIGCWENPGRAGWRVPRDQVDEALAATFDRFDVVTMAADPPYWQAQIAAWQARWPDRVLEFPTHSQARMAPACTAFHAAVMDGTLTHDGDVRLARHVANADVKSTSQGDRIEKEDKDSPAKIDLAVAAVLAHSEMILCQKGPRAGAFAL